MTIMNLFRKYLVPNENNDFNPQIFREASTGFLFSFIIILFVITVSGRIILFNSDLPALVLPGVLVDYANDDRVSEQYGKLAVSPILEKAAQMKADDMAAKGYFAHTSPEGHSPWYWFNQAGYDFSYAGENLAVNFGDSADVNDAWMNSPGHRSNILNKNFTEIGIATAEGMYQGRKTIFVVQMFGRPSEGRMALQSLPQTKAKATKDSPQTALSTSSPKVLSESTSSGISAGSGTEELYMSAEAGDLPAAASAAKQSNFIDGLLTSPGRVMIYVYSAIIILIMLGSIFVIIDDVRKHKIRKAFMAIALLLIIAGLIYIYRYVLFAPLLIV